MNEPPFRFACILLAAGASTRMGQPKQLLPVGGRPLVTRAAEAALASPAWPVIVVLGAHAEKIRPALVRLPVLAIENPAWAEGLGTSIRAGVAALENFSRTIDAALIALADQPAFSADSIARLAAAYRTGGRNIAAARYAGRLGAPALFSREHFPALRALRDDAGARNLIAAHADRAAAVDLPELGLDLDTPADYEKFCRTSADLSPRAASSADSTSEERTVK